jgi:hypothetical protein
MQSVFVVQHLHLLPDGAEDIKLIGVYKSAESARNAVGRLALQPGFRDHSRIIDPTIDSDEQGFYIDEYELDKDEWAEGFVTVSA